MAHTLSIPLFKDTVSGALGTAGTALSDPIDLREKDFTSATLTYSHAGTGATCGSATYEYLVSPLKDIGYVAAGTFGTTGAGKPSGLFNIGSPIAVAPFMKIKAVSGTSGHVLITSELNIR